MSLSGKIKHLDPTTLHRFHTLKNIEELDAFLVEHKIDLTEDEKDTALNYIDTDKMPFSCDDAEATVESGDWWEVPDELLCPVCNGSLLVALLDGFYCNSCSTLVPR